MKHFLIALLLVSPSIYASEVLIKKYGCVACHGVEKKIVGPAFKDISAKYKTKDNNVNYLADKIRNGAQGVWGTIPMPAQKQVREDEAKQIAEWILTK
jgi:cytochrome c551/c552